MPKEVDYLIQGYQKFRNQYFNGTDSAFEDLVRQGQSPKVLMVACSDSRVDPAIVMNCRPGDLFVIRNVANLVPPYEDDQSYHGTSAALEFGVCSLGIRHIILFGHTQCGGIRSLIENPPQESRKKSFITKWMELAIPAYKAVRDLHGERHMDDKVTLCGQYSLINSLKNLETFPWIAERVQRGSLFLHAWNFDLSRGVIEYFDADEECFKDLDSGWVNQIQLLKEVRN